MDRLADHVREALERILYAGPLRRSELLRIGLGDPDIKRLVRNGHLHHRFGLYAGGFHHPDFAATVAAERAYAGSVRSHFTAARLHEMRTWVDKVRSDRPPTDAIWLTRRAGTARTERRNDVVLRMAGLPAAEIQRPNHAWVTTPARTVVDLARELPLREALVTVDHALAVSVTKAELEAVLRRQTRWPGIRNARAAVALGDPRSESALESIARAEFHRLGLPPPELQVSFWSGSGWMAERVDLWWPQFKTFAEADGLAKYDASNPKERRRLYRAAQLREQRLADLGLEMVRFGWEDAVTAPDALVDRMRSAFDRGSARPGPSPTWRAADLSAYPIPPDHEDDRP